MTMGEPGHAGGPGGAGGAGGSGGAGGAGSSLGEYSDMDRWNKTILWVLVVIIIGLAAVGFQNDRRADAIDRLNESAMRIELAATHTEEVLVEVVEAQNTPEAQAQDEAVRRALQHIADIKMLLCSLPEMAEATECP